MHWPKVRQVYANQWLIVEALEAYTSSDNQRHLEELAVVETCIDGGEAMKKCSVQDINLKITR